MKATVSFKLVLIIVGLVSILYFILTPRSVDSMKLDAQTEFEMHIRDNRLDREQFKGSKILIDDDCLVFVWEACPNKVDTVFLYIHVPSYIFRKNIVSGKGDPKLWQMLLKQ